MRSSIARLQDQTAIAAEVEVHREARRLGKRAASVFALQAHCASLQNQICCGKLVYHGHNICAYERYVQRMSPQIVGDAVHMQHLARHVSTDNRGTRDSQAQQVSLGVLAVGYLARVQLVVMPVCLSAAKQYAYEQ